MSNSFDVGHIIIADTLGNRIYDSRMLPLEMSLSRDRIDFSKEFKNLPALGDITQNGDKFIYLNSEPPFYLYTSLQSPYTLTFDKIFRWHIFYITISLVFIGFLGIFLIRNLFLPMRYVTRLAKNMGIEMKKEDFVSETFNEIINKIKLKEETLVEFSAYVAHEFRNSIGAVIGLARLVEKGKKPASDIVKECRTMEELITKLLEYAEPLKAVAAPINIEHLLDDAIARVKMPEWIDVQKRIGRDIPPLLGDYELLLVVMTNLLKNSVEAIKEKKGIINIEVGKEGDYVCLVIADNGPGIDVQELDKIFRPFYSKKEGGMGLGLAYVKKIMELHNGRVDVESKKGQGTAFTVKFPGAE